VSKCKSERSEHLFRYGPPNTLVSAIVFYI